jgi:hypothetical protein
MATRVWKFKTVPRMTATSAAHFWQWQVVSAEGSVKVSDNVFGTLGQCVQDAQRNGFTGLVDTLDGRAVSTPYGRQLEVTEE